MYSACALPHRNSLPCAVGFSFSWLELKKDTEVEVLFKQPSASLPSVRSTDHPPLSVLVDLPLRTATVALPFTLQCVALPFFLVSRCFLHNRLFPVLIGENNSGEIFRRVQAFAKRAEGPGEPVADHAHGSRSWPSAADLRCECATAQPRSAGL